MNDKDITQKAVLLTDNLAKLDGIIQKLDVLSDDFCYNYLEHFDVSTDNINAKHEIKLIKTMAEVLRDYSFEAAKISAALLGTAESILKNIRENQKNYSSIVKSSFCLFRKHFCKNFQRLCIILNLCFIKDNFGKLLKSIDSVEDKLCHKLTATCKRIGFLTIFIKSKVL